MPGKQWCFIALLFASTTVSASTGSAASVKVDVAGSERFESGVYAGKMELELSLPKEALSGFLYVQPGAGVEVAENSGWEREGTCYRCKSPGKARCSLKLKRMEAPRPRNSIAVAVKGGHPFLYRYDFSVAIGTGSSPKRFDDYWILMSPTGKPRLFKGGKEEGNDVKAFTGYYEQALDEEIRVSTSPLTRETYTLLRLYALQKEWGKSEVFYKALRERPDAQGCNELAWFYLTADVKVSRKYDRALELALRAAEMTGYGDANILDTLAEAYFRDGKRDKALEINSKAAGLPSENWVKFALEKHRKAYSQVSQ